MECNHFIILFVGLGRYYLVDARFANATRFLARYRGVRYHLKDHRGRTPDNANELFKKRHSQARNVIERAFGLLEVRFGILRTSPQYEFTHQVSIVHVCYTLHNYILNQSDGSMADGDENEASNVGDTVHCDDPVNEIDLTNVFRPYTW
eukprot:TRINITY_DN6785_c0_g2_i3.p1 TRINITY_DN6785_c0_g2~~TRINITY_DN6785_c0_g2_i3.p1  ORF type:complete len:149 (-),score=17.84 TRINITY_DN6785_c0_g2_i3:141-587(-)